MTLESERISTPEQLRGELDRSFSENPYATFYALSTLQLESGIQGVRLTALPDPEVVREARIVPPARVAGIDLDSTMLKTSHVTIAQMDPEDKADYHRAHELAEAYYFPSGTFSR